MKARLRIDVILNFINSREKFVFAKFEFFDINVRISNLSIPSFCFLYFRVLFFLFDKRLADSNSKLNLVYNYLNEFNSFFLFNKRLAVNVKISDSNLELNFLYNNLDEFDWFFLFNKRLAVSVKISNSNLELNFLYNNLDELDSFFDNKI